MATVTKWNPFGVALDITATGGTVTRTSATKFTVVINVSWETYYSGANTNYGMSATSGGVTKTITAYDGNAHSSGSTSFTGTYSISGNGAQTKTITVTFKNFKSDSTSSATKNVTFNVSVPAWTSYEVTYNANGGSGAPGAQTKWKDQTLTLSSTKPTRTGYSFLGWSTSKTATTAIYSAGGKYTANSAATLYAVWKANTYSVTYNANGGTDAPSSQIKTYGVTLKLSSTKPVRTNYNFLGWATSASATTAKYTAGGNYTANAAVTLYAVWELAYVKPRIINFTVHRVNEDGTTSDTGEYVQINYNYSCDKPMTSVSLTWKAGTGGSGSATISTGDGTTKSTQGSYVIGNFSESFKFDLESTYTFALTVTDEMGYTAVSRTLAGSKFVIDIRTEGKGIAFNKPAEKDGLCDIGFQTKFSGGILYTDLTSGTNLDDVKTPNFYVGQNVSSEGISYGSCPITAGTFTLEVISGGPSGQILQRLTRCDKTKPAVYERWYYGSAWSEWTGGWIYPTIGSEFAVYASDGVGSKPGCRKDGRIVEVRGIVKPTVDIAGGTDMHTIITLPSGYRPASPIYTICQGSGNCVWLLRVNSDGKVDLSRYRNGDTNATASAGAWLPFQVTFIAEQ